MPGMRTVVDYAKEKACEFGELSIMREQPGFKSFQRMVKFITKNCLNCKKGNGCEGLAPGDEDYCDMINTIETRIGWCGDSKISDRMKKRLNYPEGPCTEIRRL